jgi:hypothetical protein
MENKFGWFGKSWGAPICEEDDHIDIPIGKPCIHCEEIIVDGDQGITTRQGYSYHLDCHLREIVGGVNHIRGTCLCCGGTDNPDPPYISKRQAAQLAAIEWEKKIHGFSRS